MNRDDLRAGRACLSVETGEIVNTLPGTRARIGARAWQCVNDVSERMFTMYPVRTLSETAGAKT